MELDYKSKSGQSIFDVSNIVLYGLDNIVYGLLIPSNKELTSLINVDSLAYNDSYIQDNTLQLQLNVPETNPEYSVKGCEGQSSFDLCIMNYGNLDKLVSMLQENTNLVSINDIDVSMKLINFNANKLTEAYIPNIIKTKRYSFATIDKTNLKSWILQTGFWDDGKVWNDLKTWID